MARRPIPVDAARVDATELTEDDYRDGLSAQGTMKALAVLPTDVVDTRTIHQDEDLRM
jgi:hypothetical protein